MSVYVGRSGKKAVSALYIGKSNSVKKVIAGYHSTGKKKFYEYVVPPGQQVFTSSGTFRVPSGVKSVDVFLVGGGGGGNYGCSSPTGTFYSGSGGGGGYTKTVKGVSVTPGSNYTIIVGSGGVNGFYNSRSNRQDPGKGGSSSAFGYTADGGGAGTMQWWDGKGCPSYGSCGGSGGGINEWYVNATQQYNNGSIGGRDGSCCLVLASSVYWDGKFHYFNEQSVMRFYNLTESDLKYCGSGQNCTTRAFEDTSGTLYSTGGDGSGGSNGSYGTGDGGDGANGFRSSTESMNPGGTGGSGCVIIRWGY